MYDVICIGGGLAGLTAAIHLRKEGFEVLVLEKEKYPRHKVCGEYLSKEVLPYLSELGISLPGPVDIDTLEFSTRRGRCLRIELPLGAVGISRYALDHLLYQEACSAGVTFEFCTVERVDFDETRFTVDTQASGSFTASFVIGAHGKRSLVDRNLKRSFMERASPWLGVKAHYRWDDFPENQVGLHSFEGGYAGLSKTESRAVNFCYLVSYNSFRKKKDLADFNQAVVAQNPYLARFFREAVMVFEKPLTIAQISFASKKPVESHILMCGDTAGLIHPLSGNGMAMAIHSAKIASEILLKHLRSEVPDRDQLEKEYTHRWRNTFGERIRMGQYLQGMLLSPRVTDMLFSLATRSPKTLRRIIRKTHGNPGVI
jgi:flavin-dependent dehydrogenase